MGQLFSLYCVPDVVKPDGRFLAMSQIADWSLTLFRPLGSYPMSHQYLSHRDRFVIARYMT
ncbi:UNVERIFIED_ORG: hypothetical protein J2Y81_008163 [Paraburkholderia sediminicola]|nr:hypothetical protein [Paraburkholderia sediminicola]